MTYPGNPVIEAGPFNGPDDPDAAMNWLDITRFVNDNLQVPAPSTGRQTDLQTVDPGPFTITLNNGTPAPAIPAIADTFGRSASNGWGNADSGQAWSVTGTASDYSVDGASGLQSNGTVGTLRTSMVDLGSTSFDITVDTVLQITQPNTASATRWVVGRALDLSNYYAALLELTTARAVTLSVGKRFGGAFTGSLGNGVVQVGSNHVGGDVWRVRVQGIGPVVRAKAWMPTTGSEPTDWTVSAVDGDIVSGNQVGCLSRLEAGNTNSLPVVFSFDNLSAVDAFSVSDLFTPANVLSPLAPGWRTGMRLRMRETIGYRTFTLADGNMLQPAVTIQTPGTDQTVNVTAVDRIGRLQQSRKFISTLTEWIRYNATSLVAHWPLVEPSGSRQATEASGFNQPLLIEGIYIGAPATASPAIFTFGGTAGPAGDDGSYPAFTPGLNSTSDTVQIGNRLAARHLGMTVSGTSYALVAWVKADATNVGSYQVVLLHDNFAFNVLEIDVAISGNLHYWQLIASTSAGSGAVQGTPVKYGQWQFVAARMTLATGVADFWIDGTFADTCTTGGPASGSLDAVVAEGNSPGSSAGQVQIYNGGDYTRAAFLAQYQAGLTGLSGQYAGDRIVTIGRYAGIPAGELAAIDQGTSMMTQARLAGRAPLDVMRDAEAAEQGLLHAAGRRPIFHARTRRYNR